MTKIKSPSPQPYEMRYYNRPKPRNKHSYWKCCPNYFANGMFNISTSMASNLEVRSYSPITESFYFTGIKGGTHVNECVLLARHPGDMNVDEWDIYEDFYGTCHDNPNTDDVVYAGQSLTLYLLSIGVYPFNVLDFNNKDLVRVTHD